VISRQLLSQEQPKDGGPRLFRGLRPITRVSALRDAMAGFTLAAMNVPQALGYTRIAGTPVATGLYTLLLPLVAFATFGSSRYLVVAADSATAAILAGGLSRMAPVGTEHYVALAGAVALLAGAFLFLGRIFELGFLADFLSQTVLVGFLTGVGFQVGIAMLGEMLGVSVSSNRTVYQLVEVSLRLRRIHVPTFILAVAVVVFILVLHKVASRLPGALFAVAGAIAASARFDFAGRGIAVIERVSGGLPTISYPHVSSHEIYALIPIAASCFVMIVAQSAATARAYASRHHQTLDENTDLVGLSVANLAASLSPTQTAMVESSGGGSQFAHLATAAIVGFVLLFLTGPLHYLPRCVLAAVVFTIAVGLVDVRGLREIQRESPGEFALAMITAAVVVLVGVEQGILLAIVLSLLRHVRHSYRPHTAVLVERDGRWVSIPAVAGAVSAPGVVIFQFGADLFYANAGRFAEEIRVLVETAEPAIDWLIVDAGAITNVDFSAARVWANLLKELRGRGTTLILVHAEAPLLADLHRHRLIDEIGANNVFDTLRDALGAIDQRRLHEREPAPRNSAAAEKS